MTTFARRSSAGPAVVLATVVLAACSGHSDPSSVTRGALAARATPTAAAAHPVEPAMRGLVGSGCEAYAAAVPTGAGSFAGMASDPLAVAVGHNPMLTTLAKALSGRLNPRVSLISTLNGSAFTVFAPVDAAFGKLPAGTVGSWKLAHNRSALTNLLIYHLVAGRLSPSTVVGAQKTVAGGDLTVAGSGGELTVNGAHVICGGIRTANATVYLIDTVLTPSSSRPEYKR